jgi:predicted ester cyclase
MRVRKAMRLAIQLSPRKGDSIMSNIEIVKRGMQAFAAGDVATLESLLTDDFIFSGPTPQPLHKAEFLGLCQANHTAFPDFDFHASDFQENGDIVTTSAAITGTHLGTLALIPGVPPVPATGKRIHLPEDHLTYTMRDGKLAKLDVVSPPGGSIPAAYAQVGAPLPMP